MNNIAQYVKKHWFWIVVNIGALVPLVLLIWDFVMGNMIDPLGDITNRTGYATLVLLVLSLACTPINTTTGFRKINSVRKSLGLQGFMYLCLHLLTFVGLDYGFNISRILGDGLPSKPYILVGFAAFLILLPLAITSTTGWQRRLKKNWKRLHKLVYLAVPLGVVHYYWVEKVPSEPIIYAVVVALLLLARVPSVRKRLNSVRLMLDGKAKSKSVKPVARAKAAG